MTLWQFNACVRAYNRKQEADQLAARAIAWQTANFTGAAFGGKLKPFKHCMREPAVASPKLTPEQIAKLDQRFKEGRKQDEP